MSLRHLITLVAISISILLTPAALLATTEYKVSSGDTLWGIAMKNKPAGVSTSEMIQAIKGLNISTSSAVVDNVVRINERLALPTSKEEVTEAIKALDKAQNSYQQVQSNGSHTTQTTKTSSTSETKVVAKNTTNTQKTRTTNNQHAIISSVDQPTSITTTDEGYQLSVHQSSSQSQESSGESHTTSYLIWGIVILLIIFMIARRLRNRKQGIPRGLVPSEYHRQAPRPGNLTEAYHSADIDASNISEVLVEAMLLVNDGRFEDARHTLQQTLKLKPDSIEIRMKLMEVYAASGDEVSFESERDYLAAHLMSHDDDRWNEIDDIYHQYFIARN
ncbi:LysM peptidoglycan-binding domain-containing protein [Thiotrichales bacterium 19S9-12]|nr:LysM peptidoglycan-binding domain-containing protein [Thiotrichales bacterium 19S9-11]MCF6811918.1 LysM peptidoglycan-binding domain-containing protein [Thiotrichales bacterium 19S9-12]